MSIESEIEALTQAVRALTAQLQSSSTAPAAHVVQASSHIPMSAAAPYVSDPVPAVAADIAPDMVPPSNEMPAPPVFVTPAPVVTPVPNDVPFSDGKGLIDYVMNAYKEMGPQKGAQIQSVLVGLGYQNINDVVAEHYAALYAGIERLRVS